MSAQTFYVVTRYSAHTTATSRFVMPTLEAAKDFIRMTLISGWREGDNDYSAARVERVTSDHRNRESRELVKVYCRGDYVREPLFTPAF